MSLNIIIESLQEKHERYENAVESSDEKDKLYYFNQGYLSALKKVLTDLEELRRVKKNSQSIPPKRTEEEIKEEERRFEEAEE